MRVLVEVDETLWTRVKVRAKLERKKLGECVGQALRGWLAGHGSGSDAVVSSKNEDGSDPPKPTIDDLLAHGMLKTGTQIAREREGRRGDESGNQGRADEDADAVESVETDGAGGTISGVGVRPSTDQSEGRVQQQRGSGAGAEGLPVSEMHGTVGAVREVSLDEAIRALEEARRRAAARNRLRENPEDESQDPADYEGE